MALSPDVRTTETVDESGSTQILTVTTFDPSAATDGATTRYQWPKGGVIDVSSSPNAISASTVTISYDTVSAAPTGTPADGTATRTTLETTNAGISSSFARPAVPNASSTQSHGGDSSSLSSDHGISNGALAGAIVGSIVGTALLTFFFAFLFYRRSRTPSASRGVEYQAGSDMKSGAIIGTSALSGEKPDGSFSLAAIIPHPADDEAVRSRILTLIDHTSLHVDNYYASTSPVHLSQDAVAELAKYNSDFLPASLVTILGQRGSRRQAITQVLVQTLLQAIGPGGELLPKLLAAQPQVDLSTKSIENALFAWRMTTAYLYTQGAYNRDPKHIAARNQAAQALAVSFTSAFFPYALTTSPESDRISHLTKLAISTAELGVWLFSQPCTFEFVWKKGQKEFTVSPAVLKTFDDQGTRLATPQVLIEAVQAKYPGAV
ncbi:hypothetical protein BDW75DRAFT_88315 [Aspergillus navahoensis]